MRKSKKMTAGILGALTLVMVTGSAMAYFTDSEQAKNYITIGKVDISLTEPNWDKVPDKEKENIVPGKELVKDPTITNTGINDAFVFMKVTVPAAELVTANEDGTKNEKALKQLYSWEINKGWIQLGDAKAVTENGKTIAFEYIYAYGSNASCSALAKNASTSALFDKITFLNVIEGQQFADGTGLEESETEINVQAYAIQTTDLTSNDVTTPSAVWQVLANQNQLS